MTFSKQPLACDPTKLDGLSDRLITSHYENNYGGAVRRLNAIRAEFQSMDWKSAPTYTVNSLKREELIAANSAFLHELYFDTLGTAGPLKPGGLSVAFNRDFGSFDRWRDEFVSIGKALGGGSGWALCSLSARENRLVNQWAPDHTALMGGTTPILALDMYEHAYHMDYGANASAYVDAFIRNIDWDKANNRYAAAVESVTGHLAIDADAVLARRGEALLIDVRRKGAFEAANSLIAGATWRDPEKVAEWSEILPLSQPVVVYCVFGHEVGQSTAVVLKAKGIDATFLVGGIHDWVEAGRPVEAK